MTNENETEENNKGKDFFAGFLKEIGDAITSLPGDIKEHWHEFDKSFDSTLNRTFRLITVQESEELVGDPKKGKTRPILVATLDVPGVEKDDVKVSFSETEKGLTRLTITSFRNNEERVAKTEFAQKVRVKEARAKVELGVLTVLVPVVTAEDEANTFEVEVEG